MCPNDLLQKETLTFQISYRDVERRLAASFAFRGQRLLFTSSSLSPFSSSLQMRSGLTLRSRADIRRAVEAPTAERLPSPPGRLLGLAESHCGTRYLIETGMKRYSGGVRTSLPGDGGTGGLERRREPYRKHLVRLCSRRSFHGIRKLRCIIYWPGLNVKRERGEGLSACQSERAQPCHPAERGGRQRLSRACFGILARLRRNAHRDAAQVHLHGRSRQEDDSIRSEPRELV